jgi:hypothetical protein
VLVLSGCKVIGLNSNVSPQDPSIEYGPLFDAGFDTLFKSALSQK